MSNLTVTEQNDGAEFHLHVGDALTVRLEGSPGTGYSWMRQGELEHGLSQVGDSVNEKSGQQALGAAEQQVFSFKAKSSGTCSLQFEYRRPWEKSGTAKKSFSIKVVTEA
jgi:predicted secreted protein